MQKLNMLGLSLVAIGLLSGCGGGGSDASGTAANTGTGYYLDSVVEGVSYECGAESGVTDKDGKFTFEVGKDCTFSVAGVSLRTTPANALEDGKEILEDDLNVARFLQSIDNDGDASNGIQIKADILEALTTALEEYNSVGNIPTTNGKLDGVVAYVQDQVHGFGGRVKTDAEVEAHLHATQTEITKKLLAGKTFYVVGGGISNEAEIFKIIVNSNATSFKNYKLDGTFQKDSNIRINGNEMIFTSDHDTSYTVISQKNGYIFANDRNADGSKDGDGHRLYASESDAQTYYDSLTTSTTSTLSALIVGKTYYIAVNDTSNPHVETLNFNADGHTVTDTWVENRQTINKTFNYNIQGDTLNIDGVNGEGSVFNIFFKAPVTETSQYISFSTISDNTDEGVFYKTYVAAEAMLGSESNRINYTIDDGIQNTKIVFKEADGVTNKAIPSDAFIRIVPKTYVDQDNYSMAIHCKVQNDGSFENNCFVYSVQRSILDERLADSSETYQVMIYKNHINSDKMNWECGENTYKYVGGNKSNWSNITVLESDFQDRSNESCNNN